MPRQWGHHWTLIYGLDLVSSVSVQPIFTIQTINMFKLLILAALMAFAAAKPLVYTYSAPVAAYSAPYAAYTAPVAYSAYSAYSPVAYSAYSYAAPYSYYI
ncbi:neuropeptide-like 4 [Ostrinia furnacalis]|uniref:neuropeptide-like 4 n=1 Tax=Ostrinia furnacalis TaxID=93504 RepID=UPI00103EC344|nr:neuropeptide-like 4 [Ostrinia furnacalis]